MLLPELQALARGWVPPGEGAVGVEPLGRGLHHETFLVTRDQRRYSLRVMTRGAPPSRQSADFEARVLASAGRSGLAPPLVFSDADHGVLVLEWLEGSHWSNESIHCQERIAQLAQLVGRIHRLRVAPPWRSAGPIDWVCRYRSALEVRGQRGSERMRALADRYLEAWASLPHAASVICHSDLHRLNLLEVSVTPGQSTTLLLDWEYVHMSHPLWDLAGWSCNNDFSAEQAGRLLGCYLGSVPGEPEWYRFRLLCWLFDYVCLLWTSLYLTSDPQASAPQLAQRAQLLETRLAEPVYGKLPED